jgi:hypothetical protein
MSRLALLALSALGVGCSEFDLRNRPDGGNGSEPDILVDPPSLTFGELSTGQEEVLGFEVQNIGASTLNVSEVVIGSGLAFTILNPEPFDLEPGERATVDVVFSPTGADENYGQALVLSDDPDTPEAPVDLLGLGAVPELRITPGSYVFGDTFVPCGDEVELRLENVGSEDLVIDDFSYTSAGLLSLRADALRAELPLTLAPGASRAVVVEFTAATAGSDTGTLTVHSNDPRGQVTADQNGEGAWASEQTETFAEPTTPPVDVMMLIDQSGSMDDENTDDVEAGIPDLINELQALADWQMIQVTQQDGCANGGVLDASVPNAAQLLVNNAFNTSNHSLTEALLELADVALSKTAPGQCNAGFLRPGALLHIIAISDEPEQSGQGAQHWLDQYALYTGDPANVVVSAVVDLSNCGDGGDGYIQAANTSGGATLDICNASWGAQMSTLATEVLPGSRTYALSDLPDPASVVVTVNGAPANDITVSGSDVTVNDPPVGEGDEVEITYGVLASCD